MEDTSLASELSAAMGDTSTQTAPETATATDAATAIQGAATTEQAAAATAQTSTEPDKKGPIPFDVHHTALDNARKKAVEEAQAQWDQQHGWAKQVDRQQVEQAVRLAQSYRANPIEFLQTLGREIQSHPEYGPQLRSMAARTLASARGQQQTDAMPEADVAITDAQGNVVGHSYSDKALQARDAWLTRQILAQVKQEFAPVAKTVEDVKAERDATQRQLQIDHFATTTFADMQTWPGMEDKATREAVAADILAAKIDGDDPRDVAMAASAAYRRIVVPKLQQARLSEQVRDTQLKAQVNTASPTAPTAGTPKSYAEMTTAEALRHELAAMKR